MPPTRRPWLMVERFSAYGFLKNLIFFNPFIILFLRAQGLSFLDIGVLIAARELTANLAEIPTGVIADLWGRRRAMLAAFAAYISSFMVFYLAHGFGWLLSAMVLFGLGEAFRSGTHKAMIMEYLDLYETPDRTVRVYGLTRAWAQVGSAVAALLAAALVFWQGHYRIVFLASVVPYGLDVLLILSYPRELDGRPTRPSSLAGALRFILDSGRRVLTLRPLRLVLMNSALDKSLYKVTKEYLQPVIGASALSLLPFVPAWFPGVDHRQTTALAIGLIYSMFYVADAWASRSAERVRRTFGGSCPALNRTYFSYLAILMLALAALVNHWVWVVVGAFALLELVQNLRRPIFIAYLGEQMDRTERATVMSVEAQLQTVLTMVLAPLIGAAADRFGIPAVFLSGTVLFGLCGYGLRFVPARGDCPERNAGRVITEG